MHNWSVHKQQILIYIVAGMLPLFIVTSIVLYSLSRVITSVAYDEFYKEAKSVDKDIQQNMYDIESVMNWLAFDNSLHKLLLDEYDSPIAYYERFQTVHDSIKQLRSLYAEIDKIEFLHNNPTTTSGSEFLYIDGELEKEYNQYINMENIDNGYIDVNSENGQLIIYQKLNLYKGNPNYEILAKVQLNKEVFQRLLDNEREIDYFFYSNQDEIVYTNDENAEKFQTMDSSYLYYSNTYENANRFQGYKIYSRISKYALIQEFIKIYVVIIFFMISIFILSYYLLGKLIDFNTRRLVGFSNHMDNVTGELTPFSCETFTDEVGKAIENYNKMVAVIHEMIIEKSQNELREKNLELENTKAKLYVLYSQINPHFLSNTLNCIKMNCIVNDEKETALILGDLSKMFRGLMLYSEPMAALWQEIDFIETYLKIQKFRFGDKLEYSIIIDDQARTMPIPRMTLQPLVENSCLHGIQKKAEGGLIQIHSFVQGNHFIIVIADNGVGITEENLIKIKDRMQTETIEESSIGIINVYKRLKYYFGDRLSFTIEKGKIAGTKIEIDITLEVGGVEETCV